MAHESRIVLNMTSEIGEMMADPTACPPGTTQADIINFFGSVIAEQNASYQLKNADLAHMTTDIGSYFDDVTSDKNRLIIEESADAAAQIVAGAATIAAAAGSWIPFVNFGLAAVAVAATATAMGLHFAEEALKKTVVEEISASDTKINAKYGSGSFKNVKVYSDAVSTNVLFYPRLQLGIDVKNIRALLLGVVVVVKKRNNGIATKEDVQKLFKEYYDATKADPALVEKYIAILEELDRTGDVAAYKSKVAKFMATLPPYAAKTWSGIVLAVAFGRSVKYGREAYKAYQAAKAVIGPLAGEELNDSGEPLEGAEASGEAEAMTACEFSVRAMGVLAGVASLVFAGLKIAEAVDTDKKLTDAISKSRKGLTAYYTGIVDKSIDGVSTHVQNQADVVGTYECHLYDKGGKNDWHYVTVSKGANHTLIWKNRAGVQWTLEATPDRSVLDVLSDCPYYNFNDGTSRTSYHQAHVVRSGKKVTGIMGPWGEIYDRSA